MNELRRNGAANPPPVPKRPSEQKEGIERRQFSRATLKTAINLSSDSNFYTGFTDDISEGGLFIATHEIVPRGTELDLEFSLPDSDDPIHARGVVRWVREYNPDNESMPGLGLQFIQLSDKDRTRIIDFVKIRETIFFDD